MSAVLKPDFYKSNLISSYTSQFKSSANPTSFWQTDERSSGIIIANYKDYLSTERDLDQRGKWGEELRLKAKVVPLAKGTGGERCPCPWQGLGIKWPLKSLWTKLFCDSIIHFSHIHTYTFKSEQGQISLDSQGVFEAFTKAKLKSCSEHFQVCVFRNPNLEFVFYSGRDHT